MDVLLVEDHSLIHEVIRAVARRNLKGATVHVSRTLADALQLASELPRLELVLLDLSLPDCSGIDTLTAFREQFQSVPLLVISATEEHDKVLAALEAGAAGYVPKSCTPEILGAAMRLVVAGGIYIPPQMLGKLSSEALVRGEQTPQEGYFRANLTNRQVEVLRLASQGLSNKEISRKLGLSASTVKQHLQTVYSVLGVSSRVQAILAAARLGIKL